MPKKGDIREDGKVFHQYVKGCVNGEYWVPMERFLKINRSDWFEWRASVDKRKAEAPAKAAAYKRQLAEWAATKDEREAAKYAKRYERIKERKASDPEFRERLARLDRESYERLKDTPGYRARQREAARRHYEKHKAPEVAARRGVRERFSGFKEAIVGLNSRLVRKRVERNALIKAADRMLRPKRVFLTPEQRVERERERKRSYKQRRRARLRGCEVRATPKEISLAREAHGSICCYCGEDGDMTVDHLVPLAAGGGHVLENIVFCCHRCNSAKRDLSVADFAAECDFVLDKWRV